MENDEDLVPHGRCYSAQTPYGQFKDGHFGLCLHHPHGTIRVQSCLFDLVCVICLGWIRALLYS